MKNRSSTSSFQKHRQAQQHYQQQPSSSFVTVLANRKSLSDNIFTCHGVAVNISFTSSFSKGLNLINPNIKMTNTNTNYNNNDGAAATVTAVANNVLNENKSDKSNLSDNSSNHSSSNNSDTCCDINNFEADHERTKNNNSSRSQISDKPSHLNNSISTFTQENSDDDDSNKDDNFIKCIFLCKFHAIAGPQIAAQVPADYIPKDVFDTISQYVIPKAQLQRCFLSVSLLGKKFLGYPVRIDNKLYARNAFYFNFCFVFAPTTRTVVFEAIVRKLSEYMLSLELSSKILSQCTDDTAQLTRLIKLLTQIRTDLNRRKMCMLQEGSTIIPLCIVPHYKEPPLVKPYVAAVLKSEFEKYVKTQWDLTTLRILPYINGFNHIDRIASMADVALGLVLDCIKHLILLGVAMMVPVFQYSNVYRPTPKLSQLAKCKAMQERCIEQCSKNSFPIGISASAAQSSTATPCGSVPKAKVRDIFRIFASMAHGATFGELCVRFNPAALNINEKQMVLFGLIEGLIRRVDKYPITVQRNLFYDDEPIRPSMSINNSEFQTTLDNDNNVINATSANANHFDLAANATNHSIYNSNCGSQPLPRDQRYGKSHAHHTRTKNGLSHDNDMTNSFIPRQRHSSFGASGGGGGVSGVGSQGRVRHPSNHNNQSYHYYNGLKSFDEICTKRGISCQQLDSQLSKDRHVIVLLR